MSPTGKSHYVHVTVDMSGRAAGEDRQKVQALLNQLDRGLLVNLRRPGVGDWIDQARKALADRNMGDWRKTVDHLLACCD